MTRESRQSELQHKETLCLEVLLSGLDARASAVSAGSSMMVYLADLLIQRCRDELAAIREELERCTPVPTNGGTSAA